MTYVNMARLRQIRSAGRNMSLAAEPLAAVREPEYDQATVAFTELIWGQGFLSPGGEADVARILEGVEVAGRSVLDIGCGVGGADVTLVRDHGAGKVTGIDIEDMQIDLSRRRAAEAGLADRLAFVIVEPGPLPFQDGAFDLVFSKDAIVQIADKQAVFDECFRVLRPGGVFAASDWLSRGDGPPSPEMQNWVEKMGVTLHLEGLEVTGRALTQAGFINVRLRDHLAWYRDLCHRELERLKGPLHERLVEALGRDRAEEDIACWMAMTEVLDLGEFGPGHLRACKPT